MMKHKLTFTGDGWEDFNFWLDSDRSKAKKIKSLILDIDRNGALTGEGHPEALKYDPGFFSRHITDSDRLVYTVSENEIIIKSCRGHYSDK